MRAVVFSDLHLREDSAELVFGEILPGIAQAAIDADARAIICLGDVYHLRYRVPVALLNGFHDWLASVADRGREVILLPGNHDQVDVRGRNVLEVFSGPACQVHTEPAFNSWGLWQPYRQSLEQLTANLDTLARRPGETPPVLWFHGGVRGAMMNSHIRDADGAPTHLFEHCAKVICGHYHAQQELAGGKVVYIGSPYQTRADESGQPKGYALWDAERRSLTRVNKDWGKKYVVGRVDSLEALAGILAQTDPARSEYRLTLSPKCDVAACGEALRGAAANAFALTPEVEAAPQRLRLGEGASMGSYAKAYLDASKPAAEREGYWETFLSIIDESAP